MPALECPFPSAINGWVDDVHDHTLDWVSRHGLVAADRMSRFEKCQFAWLAARAYPTAALAELEIVADWNIWLFVHDDQNDEAGFGVDPDQLRRLHDRLRSVLDGATPARDDVFGVALEELAQRMFERASPTWRERFVRSVDEYFEACVWEATNRQHDRVPPVATYIEMRPLTGALNTDIELIELCEHIYLPSDVLAHPDVRRLTLTSNNVVCWSNDIISLEKEHQHGDVHNLVIALKHENQISWQEAVDLAAQMHNGQVREFLELSVRLPQLPADVAAELDRYVRILEAWMRGNLDWAHQTGRYGVATAPPTTYIKELRYAEGDADEPVGWR